MSRILSPQHRLPGPVAICLGVLFSAAAAGQGSPPGIPEGAVPLEGWSQPDSAAWASGEELFLVPGGTGDKSRIEIPRLANVIQRMHWQSDKEAPVTLHPEPRIWILESNRGKTNPRSEPHVLVLTLDAPARLFSESIVCEADEENVIQLPAKHAITHGDTLRYEPQPHKNTVGYWSNAADSAEWKYSVRKSGAYEIDILQGCGKSHGGSTVELSTGDFSTRFTVEETGHFQNFIWRTLGSTTLPATDSASLRLQPVEKPGGAVMDVRAIRIVPAGQSRSFEPQLAEPSALPEHLR